ncbi:MAG: PilZ domain-containing protein [Desulfosporosinus sp.]
MESLNFEKRKHFRVYIAENIVGTAEIISADNTKLDSKKAINTSILDLSAGGMRAEIKLNLPIELNIVLRITFNFENVLYQVLAITLRKTEKEEGIYEYGFKFLETPLDVEKIIFGLNQIRIKQRNTGKLIWTPRKKET